MTTAATQTRNLTPEKATANGVEPSTVRTLSQRLLAITDECKALPKTGWNDQQKYKFVEWANVAETVNQLVVKHGVNIRPETLEATISDYPAKSGGIVYKALVKMTFSLHNVDDKDDTDYKSWFGEGNDSSDKAVAKAITSGQKTFLLKLFNIPTEDDHGQGSYEATGGRVSGTPLSAPRPASMGDCPVCGIGEVVLTRKGDRVKCSKTTYDAATKKFGGCSFGITLEDWKAQAPA